tara:strand:+ start:7098 stop:7421 length:324 start_codon:yes stop_codon:yes gene_type:complete
MQFNQLSEVMTLLGESFDRGGGLIIRETELGENFFDLSTGLAGELFQKFCNYQQKLAIVIGDLGNYSERLQELASEHRKHQNVRFFLSEEQGQAWLDEVLSINEETP